MRRTAPLEAYFGEGNYTIRYSGGKSNTVLACSTPDPSDAHKTLEAAFRLASDLEERVEGASVDVDVKIDEHLPEEWVPEKYR